MKYFKFLLLILLISAGCSTNTTNLPNSSTEIQTEEQAPTEKSDAEIATQVLNSYDFSDLNPTYKFSSKIPNNWLVEKVPAIDSINIYDPNLGGSSNLDNSVIFIRNFSANSFLTLSTVEILNKEETTLKGKPAVKYEIKKRANVPNFPNQPLWRNELHKIIDVRLANTNPSLFYVISYNPKLSEEQFNSFIKNLEFK